MRRYIRSIAKFPSNFAKRSSGVRERYCRGVVVQRRINRDTAAASPRPSAFPAIAARCYTYLLDANRILDKEARIERCHDGIEHSIARRAFLVWRESGTPPLTKGFAGHYSGKPDLASRSRGLQLIGFGVLERGSHTHRDALVSQPRRHRRTRRVATKPSSRGVLSPMKENVPKSRPDAAS